MDPLLVIHNPSLLLHYGDHTRYQDLLREFDELLRVSLNTFCNRYKIYHFEEFDDAIFEAFLQDTIRLSPMVQEKPGLLQVSCAYIRGVEHKRRRLLVCLDFLVIPEDSVNYVRPDFDLTFQYFWH